MESFDRLAQIMAQLRAPDGCPWDRVQTHESLRPYLIEESAEVLDAIAEKNSRALCEELGDLLLQVVFHAQLAQEAGEFSLDDVCQGISDKLVRRHPHVFGDERAADADAVKPLWDAIKKQEKVARGEVQTDSSVLDGVASSLPALAGALQISKKAAKVGFEWPNEDGVWDKVREEIDELQSARDMGESKERQAEELGDLLFSVVNIARWRKVDPETALRDVNLKFKKRFQTMEKIARAEGDELEALSPEEWDTLWNRAKVSDH
ncbi:nucleoside triphosphate pyrophosphohydrolase [Abditibacteriota bacterium]|nr:nucleoside triphosphate pyrophosphohydrolase [Abditibacteriota bacterium]